MTTRRWTKIFTVLLSVMMLITAVPSAVFADAADTEQSLSAASDTFDTEQSSSGASEIAGEAPAPAVCQVTFDLCGHGDAIEAVSVEEDGLVTKPADPAAEGYTFEGWYTDTVYETAWDFDNAAVDGDMILYAKWSRDDLQTDLQTDPETESRQAAALQEPEKNDESGSNDELETGASVNEKTAASDDILESVLAQSAQSGTKKSVNEASDWEYPGFEALNDQFDWNWMSHLPDGAKLNELSIPGAHDAAATFCGDSALGTALEYFTVTQDNYINGLLENGIRYFDLRINKDGDDLAMCHQSVDLYGIDNKRLKLDSVIYDMQRFLKHFGPEETLILQIKCDNDNCDYEIYQYFQKLMEENPDLIYCGDHVPTLGEVRGKLVILSRLHLIGGAEGEHETVAEWTRRRMTPFELPDGTYWALDVSAFNGGDGSTHSMTETSEFGSTIVWTEDMYNVKKWDKNVWVSYSLLEHGNPPENHYADRNKKEAREEGKDAWSIIYSSMSHQDIWGIVEDVLIPWTSVEKLLTEDMVWPREGANYMNPVLKELIGSIPDLYTGCLVGDFYDTELIRRIYSTNFMRRDEDLWNSSYDVQFDSQGGSAVDTQSVLYGNKAVRPADPVREGYLFDGWYESSDPDAAASPYEFNQPVCGDMVLYAKWKDIPEQKADPTPTQPQTETFKAAVGDTLLARMTAKGSKTLVISWSKITGADGYDVFLSKCNHHGKVTKLKKVKTIKGNKTFKWTKKKLKKKKPYKAVVKAYVMEKGKKKYVKTSPVVHAYTSGGNKNYTNPKGVTVKEESVSLKSGKTCRIKASVKKLKKGKKLMPSSHAPKLRYLSSNKKVATVSSSGMITAKAKGSCKIYVFAVNGASKAIEVTVA